MSLYAQVERLASTPGVVAVLVAEADHPRAYRGEDTWALVLEAALQLHLLTGEPTSRVVFGERSIVTMTEERAVVVVLLPVGHPVGKSLRRMVRRYARDEPLRPWARGRPAPRDE